MQTPSWKCSPGGNGILALMVSPGVRVSFPLGSIPVPHVMTFVTVRTRLFCHMRGEQKLNGFMVKLLATKVDCEKCTTGCANKQ
jgi:hypothetical protein